MTTSYDVMVIGAGTGGLTAAYDVKKAGQRVALVDNSGRPGGTCALTGCQPKKWFYETAEIIARARHLTHKGITTPAAGDWAQVWEQKEQFTAGVPEGTLQGLTEAGIDYIEGTAAFQDAATLEVSGRRYRADFFVVACGAKPAPLPFRGAELLATSTDFLAHKHLPQRIVFVGGGFISFEFAHFAARIGPQRRDITILEAAERPLKRFDQEMVDLLVKASAADHIVLQTQVTVSAIEKKPPGCTILIEGTEALTADLVVHGASRVPAIEGLNLEAAGVEAAEDGIRVDSRMQTSVPHIFAVGDCVASPALARVADGEAHTAAANIIALRKNSPLHEIDYAAVPFVLFTYPQCAMVGLTEAAVIERGLPYRRSSALGLRWPTYRRVGLEYAGYKILIGADDRILGAHIVSDNATGLINIFKQALIDRTPVDKLLRDNIMSPYPSRESDIIYMLQPLLKN